RKKFGVVDLKGAIQVPFKYSEIEKISHTGLYKAKTGKSYRVIDSMNRIINAGPFDEVANFELSPEDDDSTIFALTFANGKMRIIDDKGKFVSEETAMQPHKGFKTFDELKSALVAALDSTDDALLKAFAEQS